MDKHLPVSCAGHSCDCYKTTFCVIAPPPSPRPPPVSAQPVSLISAACETLGLLLTCGPHTPRGGPPPVMDVSHRGPGRTLWWWGGGGCLRCHDVTPPGPAEGQTYGPHRTRRRMFVCLFIRNVDILFRSATLRSDLVSFWFNHKPKRSGVQSQMYLFCRHVGAAASH